MCVVRRGLWLYNQYTVVSSCFFNAILQCKTVFFTWEKYIQCALTLHRMRVETRMQHVYRSDPAKYSTVPAPKMKPCTLCSIYSSFKLLFQCYIAMWDPVFYMGKVRTVYAYIAQNARWNRVYYPTITKQSCHVQHSTYTKNINIGYTERLKRLRTGRSELLLVDFVTSSWSKTF